MRDAGFLPRKHNCKEKEIQQLRDKQKRIFETSGPIYAWATSACKSSNKAIDVEKGKVNSYHSCYSTMNLYSTHNDGSYVNSYHSCCSILTNYGKRLRLCYVNSYHSCCLTWCRSTPEGDPVAGNSYQSCYSTKEKGMKLYFCTQSTPIRVVAQRCAEPAPDKGIRCQLLS